jgi:hypothetical protein
VEGQCTPHFQETVNVSAGAVKVYRCDWGWYVKSDTRGVRSRYLDEAFEGVIGRPPTRDDLRELIGLLDRELTAEHELAGKTVSRIIDIA